LASQLKRNRRTKAQIEAVRETAREELARHHPMTLRQVHYRLVSRDDRLAGEIPWEWMEDRMRVARGWSGWDDPTQFLKEALSGYYRDPWQDEAQEHYVEVWLEKDALSGIFSDVLGSYRITLNVGRGYDGWTSIKRAADRYNAWWRDRAVETTVLYFGDFDPSGEDMHRSLIERLGELGAEPEVIKVALTHEDARRLPGDVTKADDTRAASFVAKYGDLAVELDALPVEELQQRIRSSIEGRINLDALRESHRLEDEQRKEMRNLAEELADRDS
jgi:hypothetical protein